MEGKETTGLSVTLGGGPIAFLSTIVDLKAGATIPSTPLVFFGGARTTRTVTAPFFFFPFPFLIQRFFEGPRHGDDKP